MTTLLRFVDVDSRLEVSRAELGNDGTVRYGGGETAAAIVAQTARDNDSTAAEAVRRLARQGWSNGYIMVDLT